ncbi:MAG: hypothetical protein DCC75_12590 [Proteobacteria bacterium]|nr:MAG: hypothetical protein DCC75_12590 [Pseudomonadota bacterium]
MEGFSKYRRFSLDEVTTQYLTKLLRSMGLVYGAIDLKLTSGGEIYFLEVNPQGQYLFMEVGADLPISEAIAEHLVVYGNQKRLPSNVNQAMIG